MDSSNLLSGCGPHSVTPGAASGRPSSNCRFQLARCLLIVLLSKCFVPKSAGLTVPATFLYSTISLTTLSWTQRSLVSRWRMLPTPRLWMMPKAADASA